MIRKIPVKAIPNQTLSIVLNNQSCSIHLYQRGEYLYLDLTVEGTPVRQGAICLPHLNIPLYDHPDFTGIIYFVDLKGQQAVPSYDQLGTRFILVYSTGDNSNV